MRIAVVGAINVDLVVVASQLPGPGETVLGEDLASFGGGKGANAAVAAARAGADVVLIGSVGGDDNGRGALAELVGEGVDVSEVAVSADRATGVALIVVDPQGENQIAVGVGANGAVTAGQVRRSLDRFPGNLDGLLVSTEIPGDAVAAAVNWAAEKGILCVLNPAPVVPVVAELLGFGPIVTPNASELTELASQLGSTGTVAEQARRIVQATGAPVVVTLGGAGALIVDTGGDTTMVPALATTLRDTTGAGDTFNGLFVARLAAGANLPEAARFAVAGASLAVAAAGARGAMPTAAAVEAALAQSLDGPSVV